MAAPKRTHHQIQRDRQLIADWYCQGLTQAAIADRVNAEREYNLSQQTISRDIRAIQAAWLKSSIRDFDEMRAEQLGKIDRLEREYWRGWERSQKDAETLIKRQKESGDKEQQKTSKGQAGDPRFLAGIDKCIERRCKLLGLDAPRKMALTDAKGDDRPATVDDALRGGVMAALLAGRGIEIPEVEDVEDAVDDTAGD